jgi:ammonia channel protein AmtB
MINKLIKIICILIMIPIFCISIVFAIIWNILLILDLIIGDIRRKGKKEIEQIHREEHK